jgi:hypothetical protein
MDDIKGIIGNAGRWSLVAAVFIVVFEYFNFFNVSRFPISISWVYIYLFVNGFVLAPFKYLEHKKVKAKLCPQCDSPLHIKTIYSCDKCGDLAYKKTDGG